MKRTLRAALAAAVLFALALVVPSNEARAAEELNVQDWLSRPGVRLVAVEFYATWCKPCMEAMPRWKKLKEKYGTQGLRVIVVNTQDPDGACRALPFVPDETVCDLEGNVADAFKLQGKLPSAYLWSWQGNLLVAKGHIDEVEKAVEGYLRDAPRVIVEAGDGVGAEVVAAMRDRLTEDGKVLVLAGQAEQAALDAAKRASQSARYDEKLACEIGKEIPPNALLKVSRVTQGKASYLNLALLDLAGGCLLSSASSEWSADLRRVTQDASSKLLAKLRRPGGLQSAVAGAAKRPVRESAPEPVEEPSPAKRGKKGASAPVDGESVIVNFDSNPRGAKVEVDLNEVCAATPCRKMVPAGKHLVSMRGACNAEKEQRLSFAGEQQTVRWELGGDRATLTVTLLDADGKSVDGVVKVDGVEAGRTGQALDVSACSKQVEAAAGAVVVKKRIKLGAEHSVALELRAGDEMVQIPSAKNVATFEIDRTEVTVAAYVTCVKAGRCSPPDAGGDCNWGVAGKERHPINCVDWNQAKTFCAWADKRLPTEEEWQNAAESARGYIYPWGNDEPTASRVCWDRMHAFSRNEGTCEVGSRPAGDSVQGVKDLSGNVWEWTESCYDLSCLARVLRGGCWFDMDPAFVGAASRSRSDPSFRGNRLGFRCARSN